MSESVFPPGFSLPARDAVFNMTLIETFGNGVYTAIFWFTMHNLVFGRRDKSVRLGLLTFMVTIPLYMLAIIHLGIHWWLARRTFVVDADTSDDALMSFLNQPQWLNVLSVVTFSLMSLIADFVTVWRCWTIWNRNYKVAIVPFLMIVTGIAFCILGAVLQITPSSDLASLHFNTFAKYTAVYFGLSLGSTVISTTLIVYRIIAVARDTGFHLESSYRKVIEIIIESAILYSIILIIYLPLLVRPDFSDAYPQGILICITGIAPTLITARVSSGVSRDYTNVQRTTAGRTSLFIAAQNATVNTEASRTVHNDSLNELGSVDSRKREERLHNEKYEV